MPELNTNELLKSIPAATGCPVREDAPWSASRVRAAGLPSTVATPADRRQLVALLHYAAAEKIAVAAVGAGSKRGCGGIARRADFVISTEQLNRIIEYPASDLTITVEAGISIRELRETLARQGQMLPLDVPFSDTATLGGTLAANLSGPRRLGYGAWRDIVIGLEFATSDGKLARGGGKVVKNVAGYDIPKLLIGSFGTLGIITEVSLKVFPIPPASATFIFGFSSLAAAGQAARMVQASQFFPQALQLGDVVAAQTAGVAGAMPSAYSVVISIAGPPVVIERARGDLPALLNQSGSPAGKQLDAEEESKCWNALSGLTPAFLAAWPHGVIVKASLPLSQLAPFAAGAAERATKSRAGSALSAQAGVGIAHLYLWNEHGDSSPASLLRTAEECLELATRLGGRATVEWFPQQFNGKINPWGTLGSDFLLMQQIKKSFDPQGILNPGRGYGGI